MGQPHWVIQATGWMMLPWHRRLRRRTYEGLARVLLMVLGALPAKVGYAVGRGLARLALRLRIDDVCLARRNLALVFPDGDASWQLTTVKAATDRLGENLFDTLTLERWLNDSYSRVTDDGALAELQRLRAEGNGVLILTGHFGCWELLGAWLAYVMGGLTVVTGVVRNAPVDRLLNDRRRRLGLNPVPRDGDLRPLLRTLRSGGVAALLMDQNVKSPSLDVPFCGVDAPTAQGFAALAQRTQAPILPLAIQRERGGHRVIHLPPLRPEEFGEFADWAEVLRECNVRLETFLRGNPQEWVWFHERWPETKTGSMEAES